MSFNPYLTPILLLVASARTGAYSEPSGDTERTFTRLVDHHRHGQDEPWDIAGLAKILAVTAGRL